jgi:sugar phosphate permease
MSSDPEAGVTADASPGVSRYRLVILAVVWLSYVMVFLARLSVGPLSPYLKSSFDLSLAQVGGLMGATAVAYAPTLIVAGWLVDRVGVRRMLVAGTFITGICVGAMSLAPSYAWLLALLAISGLGAGCIYPCAVKAVMTWFPLRERATAIGFNQTGVNLSGIVGAATLPTVAERYGWQYGFLAVGALGLVICLLAALLYRDREQPLRALEPSALRRTASPAESQMTAPVGGPAAPTAAGAETVAGDAWTAGSSAVFDCPVTPAGPAAARPVSTSGSWAVTRRLLASRDIWILGVAGFFLGVVEFSGLAHLVVYLQEEWLYTAVAAGGLLALCEAAGGVAKPASGVISDRLLGGRRRPALLVLCALAAASCLALALAGPALGWLLYVVLALFGVAAVGWGGLFGTTAGELGGRPAAGVAAGLTAAIVNVGILFGPPVFGAIVDATGSYGTAWLAMTVAAVAALVCIALVREPSCHTMSLSPESLSET